MRRKSTDSNPNLIAIDSEHRICLTSSIKGEFGIKNEQSVYLTLDYENHLLVFRSLEDMRQHAYTEVEDIPRVSNTDAELLFFSRKVMVKLDPRGRITIPLALLHAAGLKDAVLVVVMTNHMAISSPTQIEERISSIKNRIKKWKEGEQLSK